MVGFQEDYLRLLTIAGSDSGGCAGIQADLKTFSALGGFGMSVIVALTAQNTQSVLSIKPLDPEFIADQMDAVSEEIEVDAVKIGMLYSAEIVEIVAKKLAEHRDPDTPIVIDPVIVSTTGDRLLCDDAVEILKKELFPMATLITPNVYEASRILNRQIQTRQETEKAAADLLEFQSEAVLLKGGQHKMYRAQDCLAINTGDKPKIVWFETTPIETPNTHGAGCTYSSAIATYLGKGYDLEQAVSQAKKYITGALKEGSRFTLGRGNGPVHHFYKLWEKQSHIPQLTP